MVYLPQYQRGQENRPLVPLHYYYGDPYDLDVINKKGMTLYVGEYNYMIYLSGDYSSCVKLAKDKSFLGEKYKAFSNNCNYVTHRLLAAANTEFRPILMAASEYMLPEKSYSYIKEQFFYTKHYEHDGM